MSTKRNLFMEIYFVLNLAYRTSGLAEKTAFLKAIINQNTKKTSLAFKPSSQTSAEQRVFSKLTNTYPYYTLHLW